ncbi:hypothetical protein CBL_11244 [Carabus blaptoides fortunei]
MTEGYLYMDGMVAENLADVDKNKSKTGRKKSRNYNGNGDNLDVKSKKSQEIRLHEIEQQLQMAESRCNKLKGQVDYMKMLYNQASPESGDAPKPAVGKPVHHKSGTNMVPVKRKATDKDILPEVVKSKGVKFRTRHDTAWKDVPEKDNAADSQSQQLSASTGVATAAVVVPAAGDTGSIAAQSINNIISGITSSVNRLTQLHANIGPASSAPSKHDALPVGIQNIKCIPRDPAQTTAAEKPYQNDPKHIPTEQQSSILAIQKAQQKHNRAKNKVRPKIVSSKLTSLNTRPISSSSISDARKKLKSAVVAGVKSVETKSRAPPVTKVSGDSGQVSLMKCKRKVIGKLRTQSSRTLLLKKPYSRAVKTAGIIDKRLMKNEKLIELYHNSAAKIITESEDNIPDQKQPQKTGGNRVSRGNQSVAPSASTSAPPPPAAAGEGNYGPQEDETLEMYKAPLTPIEENERHRDGGSSCKSYYLPTIASKMKQVTTTYFENFNFRTIPFIAAKSTSPSHNLGVNIQQVLSIIKGRKPLEGISPTLAYNIELAATKLGSRPLSALVSNLGSRMARTACPLNRRYHYGHLQDMARDIPEETLEDLREEDDEDAEVNVDGDEHEHHNNWHVDRKSRSEKCTCVPRQGVKFNELYHRYGPEEKPPLLRQYTPPARRIRKPWNPGGKYRDQMQRSNLPKARDIAKRERSLKEVLKNLHDEFAQLNERYDELKMEVNNGNGNQDVIHELEKLEKELQNKEDEITMVMTLYKEVMALKQQVRVLKKRASQSTVVVSPLHRHTRDYGERHAAGHLTTLLRHIQQFQGSLKNKPSNL